MDHFMNFDGGNFTENNIAKIRKYQLQINIYQPFLMESYVG